MKAADGVGVVGISEGRVCYSESLQVRAQRAGGGSSCGTFKAQ